MAEYMFHILKMNFIAAVMIVAAMILAQITKRKYSSKWKYFMWLVIMIFLLVPVNFSSKSPVKIQINRMETASGKTGDSIKSQGENSSNVETPAEIKQPEIFSAKSSDGGIELSSDKISLYRMLKIFAGIWFAGMVFFGVIRSLRYYFSLHSVRRWSYPTDDTKLLGVYFLICKKKHIRKPPRLLICAGLPSPMLAGITHTGLYIPEDNYREKELEFIFSHELSHYLRRDLWYKMLMIVVTTVYWFNPALYWMQREAERDIENLCDGKMAANYTMSERMKYGELLLKFAASQNHIPYLAVNFNDSKRVFRDRILYMRNLKFLKEKFLPAIVLSVVMVTFHLLVGSSVISIPVQAEDAAKLQESKEAVDFHPAKEEENDAFPVDDMKESNSTEVNGEKAAKLNGNTHADLNTDLSAENSEQVQEKPGVTETPEQPVVEVTNFYGWVWGQQVDVRNGYSENDSVIGTVYFADAIEVTGTVQSGGSQWYRIDYQGIDGYISAEEASKAPPTPMGIGVTVTDEEMTLYCLDDGSQVSVNKGTDGNWYDGSGRLFTQNGNGYWIFQAMGTTWTDVNPDPDPEMPEDFAVNEVTIMDEGDYNRSTLYLGEDGIWRNKAWGIFEDNGDGTFTGMDGTIWYKAG